MTSTTDTFRALHASGTFVIPNPFDVGSARLLTALGSVALATTSSGFAATLGRVDMSVSLDEVLAHVAAITAATDLPVNVDAERCYAEDLNGVADTVTVLASVGAAGCSIEDWDPALQRVDPKSSAVERVRAAADAAATVGLVLTARCENHLHGVDDLDDTIDRLIAYRDAGAEVVYAPLLTDLDQIRRVVDEVGVAVNVLALPGGPSVADLAGVGVRRVSIGGALSAVAYGAVVAAARSILSDGVVLTDLPRLQSDVVKLAFTTG